MRPNSNQTGGTGGRGSAKTSLRVLPSTSEAVTKYLQRARPAESVGHRADRSQYLIGEYIKGCPMPLKGLDRSANGINWSNVPRGWPRPVLARTCSVLPRVARPACAAPRRVHAPPAQPRLRRRRPARAGGGGEGVGIGGVLGGGPIGARLELFHS